MSDDEQPVKTPEVLDPEPPGAEPDLTPAELLETAEEIQLLVVEQLQKVYSNPNNVVMVAIAVSLAMLAKHVAIVTSPALREAQFQRHIENLAALTRHYEAMTTPAQEGETIN